MDNRQGEQQRPLASSTVSTTTTQGPYTTTTTSSTTPGHGTTVTHSGPHTTTVTSPTITTTTRTPLPQQSPAPPTPQRLRSSSIRIRRPQVPQNVQQTPQPTQSSLLSADDGWQGNRRRSSSEPRPPPSALLQEDDGLRRQLTAQPSLQPLYEEGSRTVYPPPGEGPPTSRGPSTRRQGLNRQISAINIRRKDHHQNHHTMQPNVVDVLDVIGWCTLQVPSHRLTVFCRS